MAPPIIPEFGRPETQRGLKLANRPKSPHERKLNSIQPIENKQPELVQIAPKTRFSEEKAKGPARILRSARSFEPKRRFASIAISMMLFAGGLGSRYQKTPQNSQKPKPATKVLHTYLGFDRNRYPGDAALITLRKTFSFCGYWLNIPPGETSNSWQGKRVTLVANGFGFLVLFNGRLDQELKSTPNPSLLGARDADAAVAAAKREGFPIGTVIFLDQEEGGRLLPEQRAYVHAWIDGVSASKYGAGIYCSGIPAREANGAFVTTAEDIRDNSQGRRIIFCVYNDVCPPSPGCALPKNPPSPQHSGVSFATVWQFAQSPRRKDVTAACPANYDSDGNCYAPLRHGPQRLDVDIDSAISADPSGGQR